MFCPVAPNPLYTWALLICWSSLTSSLCTVNDGTSGRKSYGSGARSVVGSSIAFVAQAGVAMPTLLRSRGQLDRTSPLRRAPRRLAPRRAADTATVVDQRSGSVAERVECRREHGGRFAEVGQARLAGRGAGRSRAHPRSCFQLGLA